MSHIPAQRITPGQKRNTPADEGRRDFFAKIGVAAAAAAVGGMVIGAPAAAQERDAGAGSSLSRVQQSFEIRRDAALRERNIPSPPHPTNGDEARYLNKIGNYSKGLPHNAIGEVDAAAYQSLLHALSTAAPDDFENITMGGTVPLVNPQSGFAFDLEGTDCHQLAIPPAPALASAQRAGEAVENYWMALLRDVNFTDYASDPLVTAACAELSKLSQFVGPKVNGKVTPATLFRGFTPGDLAGPYMSQFLLKTVEFGAVTVPQFYNCYLPLNAGGQDYLIDAASWHAAMNGAGPFGKNILDSTPRHMRNGRDLSAYVHIDVLFEAYFIACLWLADNHAPLNPGNPYANKSRNQVGFGTFGFPHLKALLAEVATRALKAVWHQKWSVHRALRPEEFGGRVHYTKTGAANYPLHHEILASDAVSRVFARNGTYFLPHAFPEGCPQHPAYGAGHATVAGACATIVKAFFDDRVPLASLTQIEQPSDDGLSLVPYAGADAGQITVGGEMNKIAANVAIGRNHAGVHWRSDYQESLLLGEKVAISILSDQRATYNEKFDGFTFTKFDGTRITV